MKILFVCGNIANGGAQRVISVISSELAEMGHEIIILMFNRMANEYEISKKVKLLSIRDSYDEYVHLNKISRIIAIRKYVKNINPQVAIGFIQGGYALFLSTLGLRFPKIATVRISPNKIFHGDDKRGFLSRVWFKSADAVAVQNSVQKDYIYEKINKNVFIVPNPISKSILEADLHFYDRPCLKIIMVGRLVKQKNYDMAIHMMKKIVKVDHKVQLLIYGKGEEETELKLTVNKLNLTNNILFMGRTDNIINEMSKGDLFIQASNYEGQPNALMEAMGLGLPCISTDCETGPRELINHGRTGFLIPVGDVNALEKIVKDILRMSFSERKKIGQAARIRILSEFNLNDIAIKWERMFFDVIEEYK